MNVGSYTDLYQPVITLSGTFFSPSVASRFPRVLFRFRLACFCGELVPSIVGVENVILSPLLQARLTEFELHSVQPEITVLAVGFLRPEPDSHGLAAVLAGGNDHVVAVDSRSRQNRSRASLPISSMP